MSVISKQQILEAIRQIAQEEGGVAPGIGGFQARTGIRRDDWRGIHWRNWGEAIAEAGFTPNTLTPRIEDDVLIERYALLARALGHPPTRDDLKLARRADESLPSHAVFTRRFGSMVGLRERVLEFCRATAEFEDVVSVFPTPKKPRREGSLTDGLVSPKTGFVYMLKHGARSEYKIGMTYDPLRREGEVRVQLPERLKPIHYIETDDPPGVERYWHQRFAANRKEGEWFALSPEDVAAFRRWKRIV